MQDQAPIDIEFTDQFYRLSVVFPHITDKILALWGSTECRKYMLNLILDMRDGTRAGFPYAAFKDIMYFVILHDEVFPQFAPNQDLLISGNKIR